MSDSISKISVNGRDYCFGRNTPTTRPRWHFRDYLSLKKVPTPPTSIDWTTKALTSLRNIYLNDQLGDCVIAMGYHLVGTWTGNTGTAYNATTAQITGDYSAIGGYVPGRPSTDQGCDEQTAFSYWTSNGFQDGTKLTGWCGIDASNQLLIQTAISQLETVGLGVAMPDAWVNPMPQADGFIWDSAGSPNPGYGHAFPALGYTSQGVIICTWAMLGLVTWRALARYMIPAAGGEAYVALSSDMIAKGQVKSPSGFDWSGMVTDFNTLGGNLPVPAPTPVPIPVPVPVPVPGPVPAGSYTLTGTFNGVITPS